MLLGVVDGEVVCDRVTSPVCVRVTVPDREPDPVFVDVVVKEEVLDGVPVLVGVPV